MYCKALYIPSTFVTKCGQHRASRCTSCNVRSWWPSRDNVWRIKYESEISCIETRGHKRVAIQIQPAQSALLRSSGLISDLSSVVVIMVVLLYYYSLFCLTNIVCYLQPQFSRACDRHRLITLADKKCQTIVVR